ncbi:hypothetical protein TUM3794_20810 [Shewanella colwelliana]|uniref:Uncharacterized protein n=1 Tax=Shewanella colwelliana TaxID=23 RepID=A0ABQ4P0R8_SHECO|nr:hypothetical protein [Shewanella colwelliana]GIU41104.1 hypothetical protein TUM3794_20810 [Shewanella colwelliana]
MKKLLSYLLVFCFVSQSSLALAAGSATSTTSLCSGSDKYVLGFFNGVWNTRDEALRSLIAIKRLHGLEYQNEPIAYELFYNDTGDASGRSFQDIAEVFIQRAEEVSPALSDRFEVFWDVISRDEQGFITTVIALIGSTNDLLLGMMNDLYSTTTVELTGFVANVLSNPLTADVYRRHELKIKSHAMLGHKLVLIGHSQGNLFLNNAYTSAVNLDSYGAENIGVLHIAPPTNVLHGDYILADKDLVINSLRSFGGQTVPASNVDLPLSHLRTDPSGHELLLTYLNGDIDPFAMYLSGTETAMANIETPTAIAQMGSFTATLTWNIDGDVDLHTYEPSGSHVFFGRKVGLAGELDVDNRGGQGPEHYFASCDPDKLETGVYSIGVHNFSNDPGVKASLQISTPFVADLGTKTVTLGQPSGFNYDADTVYLFNVVVDKDSYGNFVISANNAL